MPGQQKGKISATAEIILKGVEQNAETYNKALKGMDQATKESAQAMTQSFEKASTGSQSFFSRMKRGWSGFIRDYKSYAKQTQSVGEKMIYGWNRLWGRRDQPRAVLMDPYRESYRQFAAAEAAAARQAQEEAAEAEAQGQGKRLRQQKDFGSRLTEEVMKMGVLRGGLHWRFARAEGAALLKWTVYLWLAQQAITALRKAYQGLVNFVESYEKKIVAYTGFQQLAAQADLSAISIIRGAREASHRAVKDYDTIVIASRKLLEGHEELAAHVPDLMERAYGWAPQLGQDVASTFNQIVAAIETGDAEAFRQFGLFEVINQALEEYREQWVMEGDEMSDRERQLVSLNAVLQELPASLTDVSMAVGSVTDELRAAGTAVSTFARALFGRVLLRQLDQISEALTGLDVVEFTQLLADFQIVSDSWDRTLRGMEEVAEGVDISGLIGEVEEMERAIWELMWTTGDFEGALKAFDEFGEAMSEAQQRANIEYMIAQINELTDTIWEMSEPGDEMRAQAYEIAGGILAIAEAARALDPQGIYDLQTALAGLLAIVKGAPIPGFEEMTALERRVRAQKELRDMEVDYFKQAERWGLSMAEYWDPQQIREYVSLFKNQLNVAIEEGLLMLPEWERELWIDQNILSRFDELRDGIVEANRETKRGTSYWKDYNKAVLFSAKGIGDWAQAFAMEHGGRAPMEAYARHEEPLVAAMIDRLWGERFERKEGRPPTEAEWRAHWYEQWEPLELYPGGPIARATGGLADMVREMLAKDNLGGLGDVFHDSWMQARDLAPKFKDVMTEAEALATFANETWNPTIEANAEAFDLSTEKIKAFIDSLTIPSPPGGEEEEPPPGFGEKDMFYIPGKTPYTLKPPAMDLENKDMFYIPGQTPYTPKPATGAAWSQLPTDIPGLQYGGIVYRSGLAFVHAGEVFGPLSRLIETVNMRMGNAGDGGLVIQNLSIPVTVGAGAPATLARDVQAGVVQAIRGRGGTEMKRAARRLGR